MKTDYPTEAQARYCDENDALDFLHYIEANRFDRVPDGHKRYWARFHDCDVCKAIGDLQDILYSRLRKEFNYLWKDIP